MMDDLLTPIPSDPQVTPTLPSKQFVYPVNNNTKGYPEDDLTPPLLQPRDKKVLCPLEDTPPPLHPRQQRQQKTRYTLDENRTSMLGLREQEASEEEPPPLLPKKSIKTNNNVSGTSDKPVEDFFSKFRKDLDNFGNEQFPLSTPLNTWSVTATRTVTKTTVVNGKTVSSSSSEMTNSSSGGGAVRPTSLLSSDQSLTALMDELGSSLGHRSNFSKPVPVPRKISGDRKSLNSSTLSSINSLENEQKQARPTAKPRGRIQSKDNVPPNPPKQYPNSPPPKPKPYSSPSKSS